MDLEQLGRDIDCFSRSTDWCVENLEEKIFVRSPDGATQYAPLGVLGFEDCQDFLGIGYVCESWSLASPLDFKYWFEKRFGLKLNRSQAKDILLLYIPNNNKIFEAVELLEQAYSILFQEHILLNRKNLPVQLGEWYAKTIFGLRQFRSTSQRGFDFYQKDKRIEVKVEWGDMSSPKGVKIRKLLLEQSVFCMIIYLSDNLMIRDVCVMDSSFILKKWAGKGNTVFLRDEEILRYFFSHSRKHFDKIQDSAALLKYSSPSFAAKIFESFS